MQKWVAKWVAKRKISKKQKPSKPVTTGVCGFLKLVEARGVEPPSI